MIIAIAPKRFTYFKRTSMGFQKIVTIYCVAVKGITAEINC